MAWIKASFTVFLIDCRSCALPLGGGITEVSHGATSLDLEIQQQRLARRDDLTVHRLHTKEVHTLS